MDLNTLGWNSQFEELFREHRDAGLIPARVALEHKQLYVAYCEIGEVKARVTGRFLHKAVDRAELPTVGDWVAVRPGDVTEELTICAVLPRQTSFSRKAVMAGGPQYGEGRIEEQVLATNIDTVFLVTGLDNNFNLRRIERYLSVAWDSGARPVIVLNKADICDETEVRKYAVEAIAAGLPVHTVSAVENEGINALRTYIGEGKTAVFLGSSGVGKSTLVNCLIGDDQIDTGGVRLHDSRGRHTTTRRELVLLPTGGLVIDTPGLREIQMWGDEDGLSRAFDDVETLMSTCKFRNCGHNDEPGCAVQAAIEDGSLDSGRYQSYLRLQRELRNLEIRKSVKESRKQARDRGKYYRQVGKDKKKLRKNGLA